jgi:hypothetical protein
MEHTFKVGDRVITSGSTFSFEECPMIGTVVDVKAGNVGLKLDDRKNEFWNFLLKNVKLLKEDVMNITITKEKVVEAASKCTEAKKVLEVLFPEVFVEECKFKVNDMVLGLMKCEGNERIVGCVGKVFSVTSCMTDGRNGIGVEWFDYKKGDTFTWHVNLECVRLAWKA